MKKSETAATLKRIWPSSKNCYRTLIEVRIGFPFAFQRLFNSTPVVEGGLIHLSTLTSITLFTLFRQGMAPRTLMSFFRFSLNEGVTVQRSRLCHQTSVDSNSAYLFAKPVKRPRIGCEIWSRPSRKNSSSIHFWRLFWQAISSAPGLQGIIGSGRCIKNQR